MDVTVSRAWEHATWLTSCTLVAWWVAVWPTLCRVILIAYKEGVKSDMTLLPVNLPSMIYSLDVRPCTVDPRGRWPGRWGVQPALRKLDTARPRLYHVPLPARQSGRDARNVYRNR